MISMNLPDINAGKNRIPLSAQLRTVGHSGPVVAAHGTPYFWDHSCECLTCGWHCPLVSAWVILPLRMASTAKNVSKTTAIGQSRVPKLRNNGCRHLARSVTSTVTLHKTSLKRLIGPFTFDLPWNPDAHNTPNPCQIQGGSIH